MITIQQTVSLIRLYKLPEVAFLNLLRVSSIEYIQELFHFGPAAEVQQLQEGVTPAVRYTLGEYQIDQSEKLSVVKLQIEPRKFVLEVAGTSEEAEVVYKAVVDAVVELSGVSKEVLENPLIETDESSITAKMAFPPQRLFAPQLYDLFTSTVAEKGSFEFAKAFAIPSAVAFSIEYVPEDTTLAEWRIGLTRKELFIRPKPGHELAEQVYESKAPFPSNVHRELLEELERRLSSEQ